VVSNAGGIAASGQGCANPSKLTAPIRAAGSLHFPQALDFAVGLVER